jgi:ketosteroid isomerase-like protein
MTKRNAQIVRRALEAVVGRPEPDRKTLDQLFQPDHKLDSLVEAVEGGPASGGQGLRDWRERTDEFGDWNGNIHDVREAPDGCALGDLPLEQRRAAVSTLRDGKICRTDLYATWAKALEATGLPR